MEAVIHAKFKLKHSETFQENSMMESIFGKLKDVVAFMRHLQNFCLFLENLWKAASLLTLPAPIPDKEKILTLKKLILSGASKGFKVL